MSSRRTRHRRRAPREHGTAFIDPPLSEAARLLSRNRALIRSYDCDLQGRSLKELMQTARSNLIRQAGQFTRRYRETEDTQRNADAPILLAGHQPQLFHCGVWFKNFAMSHLGQSLDAIAINLLIDNDTVSSTMLRAATGSVEHPRLVNLQLDQPGYEVPFEERAIADLDCLESFGERARETIAPLVPNPLVTELWEPIPRIIQSEQNLGLCLAQARHRLEHQIGLQTLELPLSRVCQSESFHWFAAHLFAQLPRFHEIHNDSLSHYRRVNRLRSQTHPVPALTVDGDWLEAPFWLWTVEQPRRRRVFARSIGDGIELTDRHNVVLRLDVSDDVKADRAVQQLDEIQRRGIKLRPRALITTMFARLALSDMFLHGIGGAKYDELTDQIITRFFQLEPPAFMTLSATVMLPVQRPDCSMEELTAIGRRLRELTYHPEKHLKTTCREDPAVAAQIAEKRRWIAELPPRGTRKKRHIEIERLNHSLQSCVEEKRHQLLKKKQQISDDLRKLAILGSREYSFCLFEKESLVPVLLELLNREP